jgi:hypothetical protein
MQLLHATREILSGLKTILEQIGNDAYGRRMEALSNSTIGEHVRHTIEFFQCLLNQSEGGVINYDKRSHDTLMEKNTVFALHAVEQILSDFSEIPADKPLLLEASFSESEDEYSRSSSSYYREWSYVLEHAIHHLAIIKIGLKMVAPEIKVPDNFGVGPATVKYRQRQCAQ